MIQFAIDHWQFVAQLIVFVASVVGVYYRVTFAVRDELTSLKNNLNTFETTAGAHWKRQDDEFDRIESRFDAHIKDPLPHVSCPAHGQAIQDIAERLDRIQQDIGHVRDDAKQTLMLLINGHPQRSK